MKNLIVVASVVLAGAAFGGAVEPIRPDYEKPNYDAAKIAPYTLEDPLTFLDGHKLKDADPLCGRSDAGGLRHFRQPRAHFLPERV